MAFGKSSPTANQSSGTQREGMMWQRRPTMFEELSLGTAWRLFRGSMTVIACQALILCPCGFAPGWANGWAGISKHTVFAGFMAGMLLLVQIAVATGLFALLSAGLERLVKKKYVGWSSFMIFMTINFINGLYVCFRAYPAIRASIAREWP